MSIDSVTAQIYTAIRAGNVETLALLFQENPAQVNATTFMAGQSWLGFAAQVGDVRVIEELVHLGLDVNFGDEQYQAKPICSAALNGNLGAVRILIELGSELDIRTSARNPLFCAIVGRSPEVVSVLLAAGMDASVRYTSDTMNDMDATAFALMRGERACAEQIALSIASGDIDSAKLALLKADQIAEQNARS